MLKENSSKDTDMRARIVIYNDLCIIDETEVVSKDREQIKDIATNLLKTTPGTE